MKFGAILVAIAAIVAVPLSLFLLPRTPGDGSPEAGFARDMMAHHEQAVQMALLMTERTDDEELRAMSLDIVLTQQAQIGQFQGWLSSWGLPVAGTAPATAWMGHAGMERMPGMATPEQVNTLRSAKGAVAEELFLRLMIAHHQGGVDMAKAILGRTNRPEVRRIAEAIVSSQTAEIEAMKAILRRKGFSALNGDEIGIQAPARAG